MNAFVLICLYHARPQINQSGTASLNILLQLSKKKKKRACFDDSVTKKSFSLRQAIFVPCHVDWFRETLECRIKCVSIMVSISDVQNEVYEQGITLCLF